MKPCPLCGTENPIEDWSAGSEIRGTCWQTGSIECRNKDCLHSVLITIDSDLTRNGSNLLEELWDKTAEYIVKK